MKGSTIFLLLLILTTIFLLSIFSWWVWDMHEPSPGVNCEKNSDWVWNSSCLYFQEITPDPSLADPSELSLALTDFKYASGAGGSIFLPMWYRFRYVNVLTGGYSNFSSWTQTPVLSGSCCLPCIGGQGQCSFSTGYDSCTFNQPSIGISSKDAQYNPNQMQPDGSFIYMNLHRYVGNSASDTDPPPDDAEDEIVGYLYPQTSIDGVTYYYWTDILFNPCNNYCSTPSWCQKQSSCSGSCDN